MGNGSPGRNEGGPGFLLTGAAGAVLSPAVWRLYNQKTQQLTPKLPEALAEGKSLRCYGP